MRGWNALIFFDYFSVVAGLVMADCWIIRKSCVREADFSIIRVGHALENNVIATFNSLSLAQCKENCIDDFRCRSINHADDDSVCELNDQISELATPGDLKSKSGWTYHSTNYAVRDVSLSIELELKFKPGSHIVVNHWRQAGEPLTTMLRCSY